MPKKLDVGGLGITSRKVSGEPQKETGGDMAMGQEEILAVVPKAEMAGIGGGTFNLVFTNRRLIFDKLAGSLRRGLFAGAFGAGGALISRATLKGTQYENMSPEQIVERHKGNFAYDYEAISSVEVKSGVMTGTRLTVKSGAGGKKTVGFNKKYLNDVKNLLQQVIPDKLAT